MPAMKQANKGSTLALKPWADDWVSVIPQKRRMSSKNFKTRKKTLKEPFSRLERKKPIGVPAKVKFNIL